MIVAFVVLLAARLPDDPSAPSPARDLAGGGDAPPRSRARGDDDQLTGDWSSPLILTPLPTVILAALRVGLPRGLAAAALTGATIALADTLSGVSEDALRTGILASVVVVLAALVGGFTRQLWLEAERRQQETLDQVTRMSTANDLLVRAARRRAVAAVVARSQ